MMLVFYSVVLNHHQAPLADEFFQNLGRDFVFVETTNLGDTKGANEDYSCRPYLLRAWENGQCFQKALDMAQTADVCVFGGDDSMPYLKARMAKGLLSFQIGERWLKRGWINILSPRLQKFFFNYKVLGWSNKPLYKLCASAFTASDDHKLDIYKGKHFKWGYFTTVENVKVSKEEVRLSFRIMWCARFLKWKHPELVILMAKQLKDEGYHFVVDMYGDGEVRQESESLVNDLQVDDVVKFHGNVPNSQVREAMSSHDIFLFTSDKNEGWGAVLNESMSCGCVPVASDAIGSVPYLLQDGQNGLIFESCHLDSLTEKVCHLLEHPQEFPRLSRNAQTTMLEEWSPKCAAEHLLKLTDDLLHNRPCSIEHGPCSKA